MYIGRPSLPEIETIPVEQSNLCATLCMEQTRASREDDPNYMWVRVVPPKVLVAILQKALKRCIIDWLRLRPGIGPFFDSWDRILCSFAPNCALAVLNGHFSHTALLREDAG
ncbi:hypothetical protein ACKKBF_B40255 [Auxenochlorella protothecoides x Auxenochlorella symbiontica]